MGSPHRNGEGTARTDSQRLRHRLFPPVAVTSSPAPISPLPSGATAAADSLAAALQAHRNQLFHPEKVQADLQQLMQQYALICTFKDFSISDQDISDLITARDSALSIINDRFHKLIVMAQERQHNLLRYEGIKVISLGLDCLSRTICTHWGLKKTRRLGELSCPFDLSVHPPLTIEMLIKEDFPDYLETKHLRYLEDHNFCINTLHQIHFNHESGREFADDDFSRLRSVYSARIANLKAGLRDPAPLCLVVHVPHFTDMNAAVLASLQRLLEHLEGLRAGAATTMAIINSFLPTASAGVEEVSSAGLRLWNVPLPSADYVWHNPDCFLSEAGFQWERGIAERIRERIETLLP